MVALRRLPGKRSFYFHCIIWNNLSGLKGAVSAKEELFQGRGEHFVSRAVVLIFQGEMLRMGEDGGKLLRRVVQKHMTFRTTQEHRAVHHEGGDCDGSPLPLTPATWAIAASGPPFREECPPLS